METTGFFKRRTTVNALTTLAVACGLALGTLAGTSSSQSTKPHKEAMQLGTFSVSLTVKDIKASKAFYEKLDFKEVAGKLEQNWLILQNGTTTIGLFQGMFEKNIMTFNPGWTTDKKTLEEFQDVRELQRTLKERGLKLSTEADESSRGPASFVLVDPDGNSILFDQHVPSPKR